MHVKQYSQDWAIAFSDPKLERLKNVPRVQFEYGMIIRVANVERSNEMTRARVEFVPRRDAPEHIVVRRYALTIDMDTLRVLQAEYIEGEEPEKRKLNPRTISTGTDIYKALFTQATGFPVDWVIEGGDVGRVGSECLVFKQPPGATQGRWDAVSPASLDEETPESYRREFRRAVSSDRGSSGFRVVVFERDSLQDAPMVEVEQVWDPKLGWWRSFTRKLQGHLDLEATIVSDEDSID